MKPLIKMMLVLGLFFTGTLLVMKFTGVLTIDKIESWLKLARDIDPWVTAMVIVALLFTDLFVAVPTLTIMILGGYFIGPVMGAAAGITGMVLAGSSGYWISWRYGDGLMRLLIKQPNERDKAVQAFRQHGPIIILLSRAGPAFPEACACMAGITRMHFGKFMLLWLASSLPYAMLASYAGSISTLEDPKPAIFTAIGITASLWIGWLVFTKLKKKTNTPQTSD